MFRLVTGEASAREMREKLSSVLANGASEVSDVTEMYAGSEVEAELFIRKDRNCGPIFLKSHTIIITSFGWVLGNQRFMRTSRSTSPVT